MARCRASMRHQLHCGDHSFGVGASSIWLAPDHLLELPAHGRVPVEHPLIVTLEAHAGGLLCLDDERSFWMVESPSQIWRSRVNSTEKKCPYCAETIKAEAIRCKHCSASLLTGTADDPTPAKKRRSIWPWLVLAPLILFGILLLIGALSGPPDAKDKSRIAIELCWKDFDDDLKSVETRRFIRSTCQSMVKKYEEQYGRSVTLRRE